MGSAWRKGVWVGLRVGGRHTTSCTSHTCVEAEPGHPWPCWLNHTTPPPTHTLVQEMNLATPGRTLTQQRKTAINFRDTCLYKVFQLSLYTLQEMLAKGADSRLKEQVWSRGCVEGEGGGGADSRLKEQVGRGVGGGHT